MKRNGSIYVINKTGRDEADMVNSDKYTVGYGFSS